MIALEEIFNAINGKVFIIAVDIPLITKKSIQKIVQNSQNHKITLAKSNNYIHNLCGVYDTILLAEVQNNIKNNIHKIGYLNKIISSNIINFDDEEFINVNTKEDYEKVISLL